MATPHRSRDLPLFCPTTAINDMIVARLHTSPHRGSSMKFYSFEIVIEKEPEDEGYLSVQPNSARLFQ